MKAARSSARTTGKLSRAPIADIVEEHLDEAAFYLERWDRALTSPHHTLAQLRDGPEEAMLAHVDGLAVGCSGPSSGTMKLTIGLGLAPPRSRS
jgi:hypothetical protein